MGIDSPHTTHGRYSKLMPQRIAERYNEALNDPTLLSIKTDIAIAEALLSEQLEKLKTDENEQAWVQLHELFAKLKTAARKDDRTSVMDAIAEIGQVIKSSFNQVILRREIRSTLDLLRKLKTAEHKQVISMEATMTYDQVMVLVTAFARSAEKNIHDPAILRAIRSDMQDALNQIKTGRYAHGE